MPSLPPLGTEAEFMDMLVDLALSLAPRRFALCEVYGDRVNGVVFGLGMAFDDIVMLCAADGRLIGTFPSADRALARFSRRLELRLVWIDDARPDEEAA